MLKKILFSLALFSSVNLFCADKPYGKAYYGIEQIIKNDTFQSFVAGASSSYLVPKLGRYYADAKQPIRVWSLAAMIFLSNGINIFRKDKGKMKRFFATIFGAATTSFIRNK